jgi:hypothetical protein
MADIIQIRRGTATQWTTTNPVLADGELGFETDTKKGKLGNGVTAWSSLPYSFTGESSNLAEQIVASAEKTTPVDADLVGIVDSASSNVLKKLSWANIKATLKTYFDTLYATISHTQNASTITAGTFATGNFIFPANLEIGGQVNSPVNAKGNSGTGTVTFSWNDANIQTVTLTGNCTFAFSNPTSGASYQIIITQDSTGGRTITWPTIHWEGKTVPSLTGTANSVDVVTLTYDGSKYLGVMSKNHGTP